eukprot:g1566.t1
MTKLRSAALAILGGSVSLASRQEVAATWSGTKPVLVATGDPPQLAQFPSSLNRFGTSSSLLMIAQGNGDMEMPKGGFGREFASYDDGASWSEVGPAHPTDGSPRKGVACVPIKDNAQLACIPFRLDINRSVAGNRSGVGKSLVWAAGNSSANPTRVVGVVNITTNLDVSGGSKYPSYPERWGCVPDMATPLRVRTDNKEAWLLTLYGMVNGSGGIVALTSPVGDGQTWRQRSIVRNTGAEGTPCSGADENAVVRLPDGRLQIFYRNNGGPSTGWSSNVPLCTQVSSDEGLSWSAPKPLSAAKSAPTPPPSPQPRPPAAEGTPLVFLPCGSDGSDRNIESEFQSWSYESPSDSNSDGDSDSDSGLLRLSANRSLCVDYAHANYQDGQLRLQSCTPDRLVHQRWAANRSALPHAGSFFRALGLGSACPSGEGPPPVGGCCMQVSGNEPNPGTVGDIYTCSASADGGRGRAPNMDFTMPAALPPSVSASASASASDTSSGGKHNERRRSGSGSGSSTVVARSEGYCLTARTWAPAPPSPPGPSDPSLMPHGVEPKALVVGEWLVVLCGREGLFLYATPASTIGTDGLPNSSASGPMGWQRFNIAAHHNQYFHGTPQAFSQATVAGSGGDSETTGYMGATLSRDGLGLIICYDRTVSHFKSANTKAMHFNTIYCFRLDAPQVPGRRRKHQ